ncbi:MAG TPA: transposase [Firmicutes bacterium]|nr:transposase [Candidatus Fermentithermobacillaceae bacterium]
MLRRPHQNAHIESFHSILERECLADSKFMTYWDAYQAIEGFMQFHNTR